MAGTYRIEFSDVSGGAGFEVPLFSLHGPNGFFIDDGTGKQATFYLTIYAEMPEPEVWNDVIRPTLNGIVAYNAHMPEPADLAKLYDQYEYIEGYGAANDAVFLKEYFTYEEGTTPSKNNQMETLFELVKFILDTDGYSDPEATFPAEELPLVLARAEQTPEVYLLVSDGEILGDGTFVAANVFVDENPPPAGLSYDEVAYFDYGALYNIANTGSKLYIGHDNANINGEGNIPQWSEFDPSLDTFTQLGDALNNDVRYVSYNENTNKLLLIGRFDGIDNLNPVDVSDGVVVWNIGTSSFEAITSKPAGFSGNTTYASNDCNKDGLFYAKTVTGTTNYAVMQWDGDNTISMIGTPAAVGEYINGVTYDSVTETYMRLLSGGSLVKIQEWSGSSWDDIFSCSNDGEFYAITADDGFLYACGDSWLEEGTNHYDDSTITGLAGLLKIDLDNGTMESWGTFVGELMDVDGESWGSALAVNSYNGKIYMGGYFSAVDHNGLTSTSKGLLRYDPTVDEWEVFAGTGVVDWDEPTGFAFDGSDVYFYGYLSGLNGEYFARYNDIGGGDTMLIRINDGAL